jgi:diguanylate cyclase (GGDEF)-like protein
VLVPILNSEVVGSLPTDELSTHDAVRADLIALHRLYRQADHRALKELGDQSERFATMLRVGAVVLLVLLATGTIVALRKAQRAMVRRGRQRKDAELAEFETQLRRALEFVDSDVGALAVAERAVRQALPDAHASLLVADASRARFEPVKDPPVCGVARPADCPAMRASAALTFVDSRRLDACPQLAAATSTPCSATCVPVTIAGRGAAVIHLAGEAAEPPDPDAIADLVARGVGERVTLLQAFATFQLQAERDPLTGLLNRRSLDSAVARLVEDGGGYAVAFGDLDHFKRLNDLHGHDAGDRALRSFARVLSESFRPEDVVCRWGGEEFVIVLPGCDVEQAVDATERVRTNLALGFIDGQAHAVTVSFGIAGSSGARTFDEVVDQADRALRRAKLDGRNRTVTFDAAASPLPDASEAASEPSR